MTTDKNPEWIQISNSYYHQYQSVKSLIRYCFKNNIKIPSIDYCENIKFTWNNWNDSCGALISIIVLSDGKYKFNCRINDRIIWDSDKEKLPKYIYILLQRHFKE